MAATILDVYLAVVDSLATSLAVDVVKGKPTWGRTAAAIPCAAVQLFAGPIAAAPLRVGRAEGPIQMTMQAWVYAVDEVDLAQLLDRLAAWRAANAAFDVNSSRVTIAPQAGERHFPETDLQQEQHAWSFLFTAQW